MNLAYALTLTAYGYDTLGALAAGSNIRYSGICSAVASLRHAVAQNMYVYFRPMDPLAGRDRGYGVEIDEFDIHGDEADITKYYARLMHYERELLDALENGMDGAGEDMQEDYSYVLNHVKMTMRLVRSCNDFFVAGTGAIFDDGFICTICGHASGYYGGSNCEHCNAEPRSIVPIAQLC